MCSAQAPTVAGSIVMIAHRGLSASVASAPSRVGPEKTTASSTYGENFSLFSMKAWEYIVPSSANTTSLSRSTTTSCPVSSR